MKKRTILCLSVAAALLLAACTPAEDLPSAAPSKGAESTADADTRRPTIRIAASEVIIGKGDDFDLLDGVVGSDDVDGDITDRIEIDKGDYDPGIAGKYTITYNLTDSAGNAAVPKQRIINVRETDVMEKPPIWNDAIEGEKRNPQDPAVYGGAWYHKVVSSKDKWVGIEATVTLPEFKIERYEGEYDASLPVDPAATHLDNPSVYLGGNAQSESDVGLSLSRVLVDVEKQTLSVGGIAFRPFWRYITAEEQDVGGYEAHDGEYSVSANGNNCFANYHWRYTEYYYLPGDTLRMIVYSPEPDKLQLMIEVIEASTLPSSVAMREAYGWKQPANFISPIFRSPGHGTGMDAEFKRVNAIDQTANEGKTAIPTDTEIKSAVWHETYLYRNIDGTLYRVPMDESRRGTTSAPEAKYFTVTYDGVDSSLGGEIVAIHPGYANE